MAYRGLSSVSRGYPRPLGMLTTCYWAVCHVLLRWLAWLSPTLIAVGSGRINRSQSFSFYYTLIKEYGRTIVIILCGCIHHMCMHILWPTSDSIIIQSNLHVMSVTGGRWITDWHHDQIHHWRRLACYVQELFLKQNSNINLSITYRCQIIFTQLMLLL